MIPASGRYHNWEQLSRTRVGRHRATIPIDRRVTAANNSALTAEMDVEDVLEAIAALNREKAAGPDGLNNDFYKDVQDVMAPMLVKVGNAIL